MYFYDYYTFFRTNIQFYTLFIWNYGRINVYLQRLKTTTMNKKGFFYRAFHLYYDGFRSMTLGRTLWAIILIKLFIIFVVLKIFFFPNFLKEHAQGDEAGFVATELVDRAAE